VSGNPRRGEREFDSMVKREFSSVPRHIAIIMDGNGRWARRRLLPRPAGHRSGLTAARRVIETCVKHGVAALTLFAFSSENWQRPQLEVGSLMGLFMNALDSEVAELHKNNVRIRFIGARETFPAGLQQGMRAAEQLTGANTGLTLNIAAGYGGRWDILRAAQKFAADPGGESEFGRLLALGDQPDPDLFIRTGGEQRISNFLLWNLAYTELYFTDTLWPDFDTAALEEALSWYAQRQRRFGRTPEQTTDLGDA
jgi:undecaprenyl diphosphate synthase